MNNKNKLLSLRNQHHHDKEFVTWKPTITIFYRRRVNADGGLYRHHGFRKQHNFRHENGDMLILDSGDLKNHIRHP